MWRGVNRNLKEFARALEGMLRLPVIDETGLVGGYDWELRIPDCGPGAVVQAVERELGLTIQGDRREVTFVVAKQSAGPDS